jgi:hypothetical protein
MIVHREDPIVVVELQSAEGLAQSGDSFERPLAILDGAVRELHRFGLLVLAGGGDAAPRTPGEVRKRWKAWLRSRSAELEAKCAGVAIVTTSPARALLLRAAEPAVRRAFHAATRPFLDEASAREWLSSQIGGSNAK